MAVNLSIENHSQKYYPRPQQTHTALRILKQHLPMEHLRGIFCPVMVAISSGSDINVLSTKKYIFKNKYIYHKQKY